MSILRKTALILLLLSGCLFGGVVSLQADQRSDCDKRIRKAEGNLHKEIRKHGEHSRQAENRRRDLDQARDRCRGFDHDAVMTTTATVIVTSATRLNRPFVG
jgi:hypothetical protein